MIQMIDLNSESSNEVNERMATSSAGQKSPVSIPIIVLLVLATGWFVWRGPLRGLSSGTLEFASLYTTTQTWLQGDNPYDSTALYETWRQSGDDSRPTWGPQSIVWSHPPSTFIMMLPMTLLPYTVAKLVWVLCNVGFLVAMFFSLLSLAEFRFRETRTIVLAIGLMLLAPIHTGFRVGQMSLFAATLFIVAISLTLKNRWVLGGLLLGAATCLRPQLSGLFIIYLLFRREWTTFAIACATVVVIFSAAIIQMQWQGHNWFDDYQNNIIALYTHGGGNDPTAANHLRWQLINLQYPLYTVIHQESVVNWIVVLLVISGVIVILASVGLRVRGQAPYLPASVKPYPPPPTYSELLVISAYAMLTLMAVYHRLYDAVLLVLPMAWAIRVISESRKHIAWIILACILPFGISGPAALHSLVRKYEILAPSVAETWWWQILLLPHHAWILGLLTAAVFYALWSTCQIKDN